MSNRTQHMQHTMASTDIQGAYLRVQKEVLGDSLPLDEHEKKELLSTVNAMVAHYEAATGLPPKTLYFRFEAGQLLLLMFRQNMLLLLLRPEAQLGPMELAAKKLISTAHLSGVSLRENLISATWQPAEAQTGPMPVAPEVEEQSEEPEALIAISAVVAPVEQEMQRMQKENSSPLWLVALLPVVAAVAVYMNWVPLSPAASAVSVAPAPVLDLTPLKKALEQRDIAAASKLLAGVSQDLTQTELGFFNSRIEELRAFSLKEEQVAKLKAEAEQKLQQEAKMANDMRVLEAKATAAAEQARMLEEQNASLAAKLTAAQAAPVLVSPPAPLPVVKTPPVVDKPAAVAAAPAKKTAPKVTKPRPAASAKISSRPAVTQAVKPTPPPAAAPEKPAAKKRTAPRIYRPGF